MRSRLAVLAVGITLVVAACGGTTGSGSSSSPVAATSSPTQAPTAAPVCTVGVSWNNYQEERWAKWDEPAIKAAISAAGGKYVNNDAKSSDRKSTRLNSSHSQISYAVFCLKKKK